MLVRLNGSAERCTMSDQKPTQSVAKDVQKTPVAPMQTRTINGIDEKLHERIVAKVGPPIRGKIPIKLNLALKMHKAGFSWKQVGAYFGASGCTVKRRLREGGLI